MTVHEALSVLELELPVTHQAVKLAYRKKAKTSHPDLFTNEHQKELATQRFIQFKAASDLLLSMHPSDIQHYRYRAMRVDPVVRRERTTPRSASPQKAEVFDFPFTTEIDNVARLFRLIASNGVQSKTWKRIKKFQYTPIQWLSQWYEILFEKTYAGEQNLPTLGFAALRFFKLITGSIILISAFIFLSVSGLAVSVIVFPPLLLFIILHWIYRKGLDASVVLWKSWFSWEPSLKASTSRKQLTFLLLRTIPFFAFAQLMVIFIHFAKQGTLYAQSLSWAFSLPVLFFFLSLVFEWMMFFKIQSSWRKS